MNAAQARQLAARIDPLVRAGQVEQAYAHLGPILAQRTPFRHLDRIGQGIGGGPMSQVNGFLDRIASERTEGGWVVIGSALGQQLDRDPAAALARCRTHAIAADIWYGADILGERVPGPALLSSFDDTLPLLSPWRPDSSRWVRRMVGVAAHFWAKRTRGEAAHSDQAQALLAFLEPMFEEWDMDAVKGVGWGLKTLGRYYPGVLMAWLPRQLHRRHRALMLRKATTYLSEEQRAQISGQPSKNT
jgi:hypothetical protein